MIYKHIRTNREKTEAIGGLTYSMLGPDKRESMDCQVGLTANSASLDTENMMKERSI